MRNVITKGFLGLVLAAFLGTNALNAQYQITNGSFDNWTGASDAEIQTWNTFSSADCSLLIGCSSARSNHHSRETGWNGQGYSLKIYSTYIAIASTVANGNVTTGKINVGSTDPPSSSNYNYTDRGNSKYYHTLSGTPDSVYFWAKFYPKNTTRADSARMSFVIHGNSNFIDPNEVNSSPSKYFGTAIHHLSRTLQGGNYVWLQQKVAFDYTKGTCTDAQRYAIITFTTNKTPGGGSENDEFWIDDIQLIYSAWLNDLKINGTTLAGFNKTTLNYYWTELPRGTVNFPFATSAVTYTKEAKGNATVQVTNVAGAKGTPDGGYTLIKVTAEDGITIKEYKIHYTVEKSSNNDLAKIQYYTADGIATFEAFQSGVTPYNIALTDENTTTVPVFYSSGITAADTGARIIQTVSPTGVNSQGKITVKAENGDEKTYTFNFSKKVSTNADLAGIAINSTPLAGFSPGVPEYSYEISECSTLAPVVTVTKANYYASALVTQAPSHPGTATILVTAESGATKTYTIHFRSTNPNALLSQIRVNGQPVQGFASDNHEYHIVLPYGTTELPVIEVTKSCVLAAINTSNPVLSGETLIEVTAGNNTTEQTYKLNFSVALNHNADLQSIGYTYNGNTFNLNNFTPAVVNYLNANGVNLGVGPDIPATLFAVAQDSYAAIVYEQPAQRQGQGKIIVTAENGIATKTYTVGFNFTPSTNTNLTGIKYGEEDIPNFSSSVTNYTVTLPYGTETAPEVSGVKEWESAQVVITNAETLPGSAQIQVIAEDGITFKNYWIHFVMGLSNNAKLSALSYKLNNQDSAVLNFSPAVTNYYVDLAPCLTANLNLIFTKDDPNATALQTPAAATNYDFSTQKNAVRNVKVTAANGMDIIGYTVNFTVRLSDNANLSWIRCNGSLIPNFNPEETDYNYELPYGTTAVPTLTCAPQWTSLTPQITLPQTLPGKATIEIVAEDGTPKEYQLYLTVAQNSNNNLASLSYSLNEGVNRVAIALSSETAYTVVLPPGTTAIPKIYCTVQDFNATMAVVQPDAPEGIAVITVTAENGAVKTYTVNFEVPSLNNPNLAVLTYNNITVYGFSPNTEFYEVELPYGTTTAPVISGICVSPNSTLDFLQAENLSDTAEVLVTAADRTTTKLYRVAFKVAKNNNANLSSLTYTLNEESVSLPDFDPYRTHYYVQLPVETQDIPVLSYTLEDANATATVDLSATVSGISTVTVTAENEVETKTYEIVFAKILSTDASLSGLYVGGSLISGFNPNLLNYSVLLPYGTVQIPEVTATQRDSRAQTPVITQSPNATGQAIVSVTAENTAYSKEYRIDFMVAPSDVSTLFQAFYQIGSTELEVPNLLPGTFNYTVNLAPGTVQIPVMTCIPTDLQADVSIRQAASPNGTAEVTVTAFDGVTQLVYYFHFEVLISDDATLSSLQMNQSDLPEFNPLQEEYHIVLPYTENELPIVSAMQNYAGAQLSIVQPQSFDGTGTITVIAENGVTTKTYTLSFERNLSPVADLDTIRYRYSGIPGMLVVHTSTEYVVNLPAETMAVAEIIDVVLTDNRANYDILRQPENTNDSAKIKVTAEDGTEKTYTVYFNRTLSSNTGLQSISYNATEILNFHSDSLTYSVILPWDETGVPEISAVPVWENSTVTYTQPHEIYGTGEIHVISENGQAQKTYMVHFVRGGSLNLTSLSYEFDGRSYAIEDFQADILTYEVMLPRAATAIAQLRYTLEDNRTFDEYIPLTTPSGDAQLVLTTWDSSATRTYTVRFRLNLSTNPEITGLYINGEPIEGFSTLKTVYHHTSEFGTTVIPTLHVETVEPDARYEIIYPEHFGDTAYIIVYAGDETYFKVYKVVLLLDSGNNARLAMIHINGRNVLFFNPNQYEYTEIRLAGSTQISTVTAEAEDERAVVGIIQSDDVAGTATIHVTAYDGVTTATYLVHFIMEQSANARLSMIFVDGVPIADFRPNTVNYRVSLPTGYSGFPEVTATSQDEHAEMTIYNITHWGEEAIITVLSENKMNAVIYRVGFNISTNISEYDAESISIYPNPASHTLYVNAENIDKISICDLVGKERFEMTTPSDYQEISISDLAPGAYFINLYKGTQKITRKFIKQ